MSENLKAGHYDIAMDRCYCIMDIIETVLKPHPLFMDKNHAEWYNRLEEAQGIIASVYADIAAYEYSHFRKDGSPRTKPIAQPEILITKQKRKSKLSRKKVIEAVRQVFDKVPAPDPPRPQQSIKTK